MGFYFGIRRLPFLIHSLINAWLYIPSLFNMTEYGDSAMSNSGPLLRFCLSFTRRGDQTVALSSRGIYHESGVSPVSKRYMRAGIGNDRLVVCLSEYLPLRIVYRISSMSTIGKYIELNRQYAMVSVMFVLLTIGGAPVSLVLVFAATRKEMSLRSVSALL